MKLFLKRTLLFLMIPVLAFVVGMLLPPTTRAKQSLLLSKIQKDSLLRHSKQPRIIFVAGSSMGFGLNSQVFKDSLHRNPINTGIHGGLGLYYMLDNAAEYLQPGDIVVLAPEYHQFYGNFCEGSEELLRVFFDNQLAPDYFKLRYIQFLKTYPYMPRYAMSKFMPAQYYDLSMKAFYSKGAYNKYGDVVAHYGMKHYLPVVPFKTIDGESFNQETITAIVEFSKTVKARGATLYVGFPAYQETSFNYCKDRIHYYENELKKQNLTVLGTPERYIMTDEFIFDTPYHLNKEGINKRTQLLLEDVKSAMEKDRIR